MNDVDRIAVEANCSPRTVRRYFRGRVSPATRVRIEAAIDKLGLKRADVERCFVYFVECVGYDRIKIGASEDPVERIERLRSGAPGPLRLLGVIKGDEAVERELHLRFKDAHVHGEWFTATSELRSYIEERAVAIDPKRRTGSTPTRMPTALYQRVVKLASRRKVEPARMLEEALSRGLDLVEKAAP